MCREIVLLNVTLVVKHSLSIWFDLLQQNNEELISIGSVLENLYSKDHRARTFFKNFQWKMKQKEEEGSK